MNAYSIIKKSGAKEEFSEGKLSASLIKSGVPKRQAQTISQRVLSKFSEGVTSKKISAEVHRLLKKESKILATHYCMDKAILQFGPDGHIFGQFLQAVFNALNYKSKTNVYVQGQFVKHEIDVVAKKDHQTIYCECKFHNRPETKNDLKTALYVYARSLDVKNNSANELTDFWLVSNTKFTRDALQYAQGVGLTLIGPYHPPIHNLTKLIEQSGVYPITCLSSLKKHDAKKLLELGIIIAKDLLLSPNILDKLNLTEDKKRKVIKEAKLILSHKK